MTSLPREQDDCSTSVWFVEVPSTAIPRIDDARLVCTLMTLHDWSQFLAAYADGRWSPNRTPQRPSTTLSLSSPSPMPPLPTDLFLPSLPSNSGTDSDDFSGSASASTGASAGSSGSSAPSSAPSTFAPYTRFTRAHSDDVQSPPLPTKNPDVSRISQRAASTAPLRVPIPPSPLPHLHLVPTQSVPATKVSPSSPVGGGSSGIAQADIITAAATVRWAASSHPSLAPLALPSPERELMDPMRGVTVAVKTEKRMSSDSDVRLRVLSVQPSSASWSSEGSTPDSAEIGKRMSTESNPRQRLSPVRPTSTPRTAEVSSSSTESNSAIGQSTSNAQSGRRRSLEGSGNVLNNAIHDRMDTTSGLMKSLKRMSIGDEVHSRVIPLGDSPRTPLSKTSDESSSVDDRVLIDGMNETMGSGEGSAGHDRYTRQDEHPGVDGLPASNSSSDNVQTQATEITPAKKRDDIDKQNPLRKSAITNYPRGGIGGPLPGSASAPPTLHPRPEREAYDELEGDYFGHAVHHKRKDQTRAGAEDGVGSDETVKGVRVVDGFDGGVFVDGKAEVEVEREDLDTVQETPEEEEGEGARHRRRVREMGTTSFFGPSHSQPGIGLRQQQQQQQQQGERKPAEVEVEVDTELDEDTARMLFGVNSPPAFPNTSPRRPHSRLSESSRSSSRGVRGGDGAPEGMKRQIQHQHLSPNYAPGDTHHHQALLSHQLHHQYLSRSGGGGGTSSAQQAIHSHSLPNTPRRGQLPRQTSSPLPASGSPPAEDDDAAGGGLRLREHEHEHEGGLEYAGVMCDGDGDVIGHSKAHQERERERELHPNDAYEYYPSETGSGSQSGSASGSGSGSGSSRTISATRVPVVFSSSPEDASSTIPLPSEILPQPQVTTQVVHPPPPPPQLVPPQLVAPQTRPSALPRPPASIGTAARALGLGLGFGSGVGSGSGSGSGGSGGGGGASGGSGSGDAVWSTRDGYTEKGYLAPPNPKDEIERRRALYKFNVLNTSPDANFDRIAYLAKLVFSTKVVSISLVDEHDVWFKSAVGVALTTVPRNASFSAHAILQRNDEPTVVLDSANDWRFARNPMVAETPFVRFWAAAPLRTQDGFNIGTLCIMDDQPRTEFSPKQRHTLKEFAAVVMREMELWRDKIQLRIRERIQNSMEQFTRECLEIDRETEAGADALLTGGSMEKVYERAARLVKRTLDVEGAVVMDVSHVEVLETTKAEAMISIVSHHGDASTSVHSVSNAEYAKIRDFFVKFPQGKVTEGVVPLCFRSMLPTTRIQHALLVPIFNIDKQPFALLCAYNTADHVKPFLEGHELSYLRAIGVIILSAVLKRRMILADKSKSLFISNISHELRTPLHGILAAAELLADTTLDHNQASFLRTVQACGTSLVETVNHVLDFTKLSGNSKGGGVENVILPSKVNLMQLVEEAAEGSWIGHRARLPSMVNPEIGSVYSPPEGDSSPVPTLKFAQPQVETVVDIGYRASGWHLCCEKGGIRRVLMNIIGNSLKFTTSGYVHITLRELPHTPDMSPSKVKVELSVLDSGKGISKDFLKNQLFHPFSQENPLMTGTGLGLAIVNSIIRSESVHGQVDVSSAEGVGTEIRITFDADACEELGHETDATFSRLNDPKPTPTVTLIGFDEPRGATLLGEVLKSYISNWWGLDIQLTSSPDLGDIVIINEDIASLIKATVEKDVARPIILLSSSRGDAVIMSNVNKFERIGGHCRIVFKPVGPSRLRQVLKACIRMVTLGEITRHASYSEVHISSSATTPALPVSRSDVNGAPAAPLSRRKSHETPLPYPTRPGMTHRPHTFHATLPTLNDVVPAAKGTPSQSPPEEDYPSSPGNTTIAVGNGGSLLKSSVGTLEKDRGRARVLVVEDNSILRDLLIKWLKTRGYRYEDATDGRDGVNAFEKGGHFDVILLDLSMPKLDGIGATTEIRAIEASRLRQFEEEESGSLPPRPTKILALTGMSSLEDKRRAFAAGVDGYLVKPVAFKTLDEMFRQLGVSHD